MMKNNFLKLLLSVFILLLFFTSPIFAISISGGLIREVSQTPGSKTVGKIMLTNGSAEPQTIKIYQTEYLHNADGQCDFGQKGINKKSNLEWITFFPQQITLPAKQAGYIDYTIDVPKDADLSGTYWSVLMIEPVTITEEPRLKNKGKLSIGVKTILRYAIQIITNFEKGSDKSLKFIEKHLEVKENEKTFQIDLENTGNRLVKATVWMDLFDEKGVSLGRFDAGNSRIFPACSSRFKADLSSLPQGGYTALLIADIGNDKVFGAKYKLKIP